MSKPYFTKHLVGNTLFPEFDEMTDQDWQVIEKARTFGRLNDSVLEDFMAERKLSSIFAGVRDGTL